VPVVVIDSSFVVAVVVREAASPFAHRMFTSFGADRLIAPLLLHWEFTNVLSRKLKRGEINPLEVEGLVLGFEAFGIELQQPALGTSMIDAVKRAADWGLSGYDAAYLDLALAEGAHLATLDERLAKVATAAGVVVHGPHP
jgi:predicted nucleic acid-binding protein